MIILSPEEKLGTVVLFTAENAEFYMNMLSSKHDKKEQKN